MRPLFVLFKFYVLPGGGVFYGRQLAGVISKGVNLKLPVKLWKRVGSGGRCRGKLS